MNKLLKRCINCRTYTLEEKCPKCGEETRSPHPPKFSPDDRYIRYRVRENYACVQPTQTTDDERSIKQNLKIKEIKRNVEL
jgi:H/ACA ribonucleoprotein complex subunit 3